jgi:beta-lactamase regulating signal transducer with metallopeptidase domain
MIVHGLVCSLIAGNCALALVAGLAFFAQGPGRILSVHGYNAWRLVLALPVAVTLCSLTASFASPRITIQRVAMQRIASVFSESAVRPVDATPLGKPKPYLPARVPIPIEPLLFSLWLLGVFVGASRTASEIAKNRRLLKRARAPRSDVLVRLQQSLEVAIDVRVSSQINVPQVVGYLRPCIVLPERLLYVLSNESLRQVLLHEMRHAIARDNLSILFERCIVLLFWCNPAAWIVAKEIAFYREMRCDEAAIESSPTRYLRTLLQVSHTLIRVNEPGMSSAAVHSKKIFLRRVHAIAANRVAQPLPVATSFAAALTAALCVWIAALAAPPMSSSVNAFEKSRTDGGVMFLVGRWTCFDGAHRSNEIGIASFEPVSEGLREENRSVGGHWTYRSSAIWTDRNGVISVRGSDNSDRTFQVQTAPGASFDLYSGVSLNANGYRSELTAVNGNRFDFRAFVYKHARWNLMQRANCERSPSAAS